MLHLHGFEQQQRGLRVDVLTRQSTVTLFTSPGIGCDDLIGTGTSIGGRLEWVRAAELDYCRPASKMLIDAPDRTALNSLR